MADEVFVLDASAVLALLNAEPGAERVTSVLRQAVICSVNRTEVLTRLLDWDLSQADAAEALQALELNVSSFDHHLADAAAWLRRDTHKHGLSLGDRACLALAQQLGARVLTTDRAWQSLDLGITIENIRPDRH